MESNKKHTITHIGFISPEYPHAKVKRAAGIGTSIKNLADALVKQNIRVSVFVYNQDLDAVEETHGVTLHFIKHKSYPLLGWYLYRKHINTHVNRVVKQDGIQLIEAADWTGITAFMKFKVPLVIRLHGSDAYFCKLEGRPQKKKNFWLEKLAMKNASAFVAPTQYTGRISQQLFQLDASKIATVFNAVDSCKFNNSTPEIYETNTLVYVGTLIRKKGVLELVSIFQHVLLEIPDAKLLLIGADALDYKTGKSTYQLMQEISSLQAKKQMHYIGKVPYESVVANLKKAHVCVFPSMAETFGMVTIEAMALQKPVVNTNYPWAKELIEDGVNGYLENPKEHKQYAKKIIRLLKSPEHTLHIGKQAKDKVTAVFNSNVVVKKNISLYNSLLQ